MPTGRISDIVTLSRCMPMGLNNCDKLAVKKLKYLKTPRMVRLTATLIHKTESRRVLLLVGSESRRPDK